jgi:hypothetical protein
MKFKMRHHLQSRASLARRNQRVSKEIQKFLSAVDSYPEHFAQEPGLSFRRYLASQFETARNANSRIR